MADELILPRPFVLRRAVDVSGVSGTGDVAHGYAMPSGGAVILWAGERPSLVVWDRLEDAIAVHGHGGLTALVFADEKRGLVSRYEAEFEVLRGRCAVLGLWPAMDEGATA